MRHERRQRLIPMAALVTRRGRVFYANEYLSVLVSYRTFLPLRKLTTEVKPSTTAS